MLDGAGPVRSRALRLLRPDGTTTHVAADMVFAAETADEPQFFSIQLRDTTHEARREGLEKAKVAIRDRIEQGQPLKGTLDEVVLPRSRASSTGPSASSCASGPACSSSRPATECHPCSPARSDPCRRSVGRAVLACRGAQRTRGAHRRRARRRRRRGLPGLSGGRSAGVVLVARLGSERLRRRNG